MKLPVSSGVLAPYTTYYYRFIYNQIPSRTGRFKTLPNSTASLAQLKIGYVVCQDYGNGYYTALSYLAQEDVDYVVHLGDYIYETITSALFQNNPVRTVPPFPSGSTTVPVNVDDYRHLYKVYRSDVNQQAVHEQFAYIQLWDDHEFANDSHQDFHPDDNTAPNTATPFQGPMGVELMVGSISSANFAEEIESAVSLPSAPLPAKQMGVPPNLLDPVIRTANRHIQYWDSSTHGYGVLTITPQQLVCEFKAVTTIQQPTASLVPLKTFTVPVDQVALIQS